MPQSLIHRPLNSQTKFLMGRSVGEVVEDISKALVFSKCDVCDVVLKSTLAFTNHMKKRRRIVTRRRINYLSAIFASKRFCFSLALTGINYVGHR